jgi:hypothetical protein
VIKEASRKIGVEKVGFLNGALKKSNVCHDCIRKVNLHRGAGTVILTTIECGTFKANSGKVDRGKVNSIKIAFLIT